MRGRADLHRLLGDIDVAQLLELVIHAGQLPLDVLRRVGDLGIAQQQMVEIARALSLQARILIMDEPTSALTAPEIRELFRAIRQLKASGVGIIYISHRLEELLEIGDRVTVLRDGHAVATHKISDVSLSELIRLMVNREFQKQFPKHQATRGEELLREAIEVLGGPDNRLEQARALADLGALLRRGIGMGEVGQSDG